MLKEISERLFWNVYAVCYDSISTLSPYQEMQEEIVRQSMHETAQSLLDAGCGTGNFLRRLIRSGGTCLITAVDASPSMLARAKKKCASTPVRWEQLNLNSPLPFPDGSFDRVVCTNVLFALESPPAALREIHRVLKQGGRLVLATPNTGFDTKRILNLHLSTLRSWTERIKFSPMLVPLYAAMALNLIIRKNSREKIYHFFDEKSLADLFSARFSDIRIKPTYAGQDWLVVADKGVEG